MHPIGSMVTYICGIIKDLVSEKEEIKCNNIIKQYIKCLTLMILQKNMKKHNPSFPQILDHPYRILIIGRSGTGKTSSLFNVINNEPDIDKIYLYANDEYEAKHQILINKH